MSDDLAQFLWKYPHVPLDIAKEVYPYVIPDNHPIKPQLDAIFSKPVSPNRVCNQARPTSTPEHFKAAGFFRSKLKRSTPLMTGLHPQLKGYFIKAYADSTPGCDEWMPFVNRIRGADEIRTYIERHGLVLFKVPRKWLYILPIEPLSSIESARMFILVAEKMNVLDDSGNYFAWKTKITHEMLDQLFQVIVEVGLSDSVYPDNVMLTKDGKFAFIDTEAFGNPNAIDHLPILLRYLSPQMQAYWSQLIESE